MSHTRLAVLAVAAIVALLAVNAAWLHLDHSPPAWDDSYYLANSLRNYDALTDGGLAGFTRQFLMGMSTKPPLIAALPTPLYLVLGRHPRAAIFINLEFLLVTLIATHLLAKRFAGLRAGVIAVCIVGAMPISYGLSRLFLVECGLTALAMVALLIVASMESWSLRAALGLGIVFGFGLLMKTSFPLYLAPPILWMLIRTGRTTVTRGTILAFLVPVCLIAGPWYAIHTVEAIRTTLNAGSVETARAYGTGGLAQTGVYLRNLLNCGPPLYFIALPLLALLGWGKLSVLSRRGVVFCLIAASPIAFLALSHYRDLRYAAPLFPAIAVAVALLADGAISRFPKAATALVCLLLALGLGDMLYASFGIPGDFHGVFFNAGRFSYVRPPQRATPPYRDLLNLMESRGKWIVGRRHRLVLASDTRYCNADIFTLAALAARIPVEVATTAYESAATLHQSLAPASFFGYVDGAIDSPFNPLGHAAIATVTSNPRVQQIAVTRLPDGSLLHLLEMPAAESDHVSQEGAFVKGDLEALTQCSIKFADGVELTGLLLRPSEGGITAHYRWRSWRRTSKNYWSFGHVLDAQGKVVAYLDHAILQETPTSRWDVGDTAMEAVTVPIPGGAVPKSVRLGIFDRDSGERVAIVSSTFPLADSGSATVAPVK